MSKLSFLFSSFIAQAQTTAQPVKMPLQIPIFDFTETIGITPYIAAIFKYGLYILVPIAIVIIMLGGITWITSAGEAPKIKKAKDYITSALLGLVIAFLSYYILSLVNLNVLKEPSIAYIKADPEAEVIPIDFPIGANQNDPNYAMLPGVGCESSSCDCQEAMSTFAENNINVASGRNCASLDKLPEQIVQQVVLLQELTGCNLTVTSGNRPEANRGNGACHGNSATSCLDFRNNPNDHCLYDAISRNPSIIQDVGIDQICTTSSYQSILYNCPPSAEAGNPDHIHIKF